MRKIKGFILFTLLLVFAYIYFNFLVTGCPEYAPKILAAFMIALAYLAYFLYGFPRYESTSNQVMITKVTVVSLILYFLSIYIFGIFKGITVQSTTLSIFIPIITIIATEMLRYIVINANRDTGIFSVLITVGIIVIQVAQKLDASNLLTTASMVNYISTVILPIVIRNILLSIYSNHVDITIAIIYAILVVEFRNIIPWIPNLGDFTYLGFEMIMSFGLITFASRLLIKHYEGYSMITCVNGFSVLDAVIIVLFVAGILLISGVTPFKLYEQTEKAEYTDIVRGDGPIIKTKPKISSLKKKDIILVLNKDKTKELKVVNRVDTVTKKNAKGEKYEVRSVYIIGDKGEAVFVDDKKIVGKVLFNLKYIFKPGQKFKEAIGVK